MDPTEQHQDSGSSEIDYSTGSTGTVRSYGTEIFGESDDFGFDDFYDEESGELEEHSSSLEGKESVDIIEHIENSSEEVTETEGEVEGEEKVSLQKTTITENEYALKFILPKRRSLQKFSL